MAQATLTGRGIPVSKPGSGYRPDIEGLRAVAVVLVLLSHARVPWFEGGFIGVDVFFVISGFLITRMLLRELRATARIRLGRFYARRARRLLPASAVVLAVSALLTWAFLPQNRWADTAHDIMFSAVYLINWSLASQSVDYLRADSAPSIVQHFWSLAVEEQFYIIWPCLLVLAALIGRWRRVNLTRAVAFALALVGVPSLAWSIYYSVENPARAYFVSTTRVWELALGAALAILVVNGVRLPRVLSRILGWAGLAAVLAAGVLFSTSMVFPGYWALVPTLGAATIILAGGSVPEGGGAVGRVLGTRPMEKIGGLSYSLYLVHWPAVVVATALLGTLEPWVGLVVVTLSVIPAYLLHHYVENPIRFNATTLAKTPQMLRAGAVITVLSLTAAMALQLATWPPPPPFVPPAVTSLAAGAGSDDQDGAAASSAAGVDLAANPGAIAGALALGDPPFGDPDGAPQDISTTIVPGPLVAHDDYTDCTQSAESSEVRSCEYGKRDSPKTIAVVGDSHANQWVPGIVELAGTKGWRVVEYTKAACTFSDVLISTKEGTPYTSCQEWSKAVKERLLGPEKPTMVVTSGLKKRVMIDGQAIYDQRSLTMLSAALRANYEALNQAGVPVVVIQDTPTPEVNIPECVQANTEKLSACAGDRSVMIPDDHGAEQVEAVAGLQQTRMIDLNDFICPADRCAAVIGNVLLYRDASHVTGTYIRTLLPRLEKELQLT